MTGKTNSSIERTNQWLLSRLDHIWTKYFSDVPQTSKVFIKFGRFARFRLGSIKFDKKSQDTTITITAMFKQTSVPKEVIDYTIAHELVHFAHGFSSPHPRLHKYPHEGGIVRKEMAVRGMGSLFLVYKSWIKSYRRSLRAQRYG